MHLEKLLYELKTFVKEREWDQFHTPQNLAKSISIEASELLECFQWGDDADETSVRHELADILIYCLLLADKYDFDLHAAILEKIFINRKKYPIDKSRGKSDKYDRL